MLASLAAPAVPAACSGLPSQAPRNVAPRGLRSSALLEGVGGAGCIVALAVAATHGGLRIQRRRSLGLQAVGSESRRTFGIGLLAGVTLVGLTTSRSVQGAVQPVFAEGATTEDEIVKVVDGDTVLLAKGGRCRFIGVNTPETVSPKQQIEGAPPDCFGPEASKLTKSLLPPGTKVRVEFDVGPTDKYGRTLAYVYRLPDGLFINEELVRQGAARRFKVPPNVRYDTKFKELETEAATSGKGLWKACPAKSAKAGQVATSRPAVDADAELANPGNSKNCKDFATFADAKQWFDAYYPLYGDVAKLDGDGDGIPCEGLLKKERALAKAK
mmetsp:Transcript_15178/g.34600  ORF Transcript_15178/g.34600 Transcript_15178/m.34600 type:complete len:328 (+) Transcript_15178:46-1029(+)